MLRYDFVCFCHMYVCVLTCNSLDVIEYKSFRALFSFHPCKILQGRKVSLSPFYTWKLLRGGNLYDAGARRPQGHRQSDTLSPDMLPGFAGKFTWENRQHMPEQKALMMKHPDLGSNPRCAT